MKATRAIVQLRVEDILALRLAGATLTDARQYVSAKCSAGEMPWAAEKDTPPPCDRTLWRYITKADRLMMESVREGRKRSLRRHLALRQDQYSKADQQGDGRAALAVLSRQPKLLDLFPSPDAKLLAEVERLAKSVADLEAKRPHGDSTIASESSVPTGASPHPDGEQADPGGTSPQRPDAGDDGLGDGA